MTMVHVTFWGMTRRLRTELFRVTHPLALLALVRADDPAGSWLSYARYDAPNSGCPALSSPCDCECRRAPGRSLIAGIVGRYKV